MTAFTTWRKSSQDTRRVANSHGPTVNLIFEIGRFMRARKRLTLNTALLPKPRGAKAVTKGVSEAYRGRLMPAFGTPFSMSS